MQVVLVRAEAKLLAISESGNIFLKRGLKVSAAVSGMLWSTNAAATWTSADVTWKLKKRDDGNLGGSMCLRTLENISIVFFLDKNKDVSAITFIIATTHLVVFCLCTNLIFIVLCLSARLEKRCLVPASLGVFLMLVSLDVPLNITNSLFPTVDDFVAQCAAETVFVVLHWNNTRPRLRPCMVEVGLIHKWPSEFLFDDSITKLLPFLGRRATLRILYWTRRSPHGGRCRFWCFRHQRHKMVRAPSF